eukprot:TRINITY_DN7425_c0_g1_i1.p1 TRINITY_DN7425_c0_g1~~TRINITY_DN7425_c0_g1_i1.p1  ORF type:complete len:307 (+),score=93.92 TRINITY_DN7425_c0_g1_i1:110-1030(+)
MSEASQDAQEKGEVMTVEEGTVDQMDQMNAAGHQLYIPSISDEQLYNRCPQNNPLAPNTNQKNKTVKKAYPEVFIPDDVFPQLNNNSALRCYLVPYAAAELSDFRNPNVLREVDIDAWVKTNGFYSFPILSVNSNPVLLNFKFPQRSQLNFKAEDKNFGLLMLIEGPNGISLKGISPSFRLSVKIGQFVNKIAANERIRRHTKPTRKDGPRKSSELSASQDPTSNEYEAASLMDLSRSHLYNPEIINAQILDITNSCPHEALPELIEFLEYQTSQLRKKVNESPSKRAKTNNSTEGAFNIEEQHEG